MPEAINCAVIGSGYLGTDLLLKLSRSAAIDVTLTVGVDPDSPGLAKARVSDRDQ